MSTERNNIDILNWPSTGGSQPAVLQQVTVKIQTNEKCKKNYGNDAPGGIVDHFLCAANPGKDSCSVSFAPMPELKVALVDFLSPPSSFSRLFKSSKQP